MSPSSCTSDDDDDSSCVIALTRAIDVCPLPDPDCTRADRSDYRTFDGSCNNEVTDRRAWGMANTAQVRILPPQYQDGVGSPRALGKDGAALPNARLISTIINNRFLHVPSITYSYMLMQYGQFLDHDLSHTDAAEIINENGRSRDIDCDCGVDMTSPGSEDCFNIEVPSGDRTAGSRECLPVTRSAAWPEPGCVNSERQQVNSITSFIDCSQVYGSSRGEANKLRDSNQERGKLATTDHPTHPEWKKLLPYLNDKDQLRDCAVQDFQCFLAGDVRRNAQPGLMAMHTIWVRAHNYIEEQLHALNSEWDGEKLYQESRRLLIAITQHITYNEYLDVFLGKKKMMEENPHYGKSLRVDAGSSDYATVYDSSVQPNIANVFSTAAYRIGHSEIKQHLKFLSEFRQSDDLDCDVTSLGAVPAYCIKLRETFNNPTTIYENPADREISGVDSVLLGILKDAAERIDLWYTEEISDYLFTEKPDDESVYGYDLLALNVQRGRDHGLPGYMAYRQHYGLSVSTSWDNRPADMNENEWEKLGLAYADPADIDVYAGGLLEKHSDGSKMGDLFTDINAQQFMKLKVGDRFWYENGGMDSSFTLEQLIEIRKMTFAGLLCVTMDNPGLLPKNVFDLFEEDKGDALLPCAQAGTGGETHPEIDFTKWQA